MFVDDACMDADTVVPTADVVMGNVPLVLPAGIVSELGTPAAE